MSLEQPTNSLIQPLNELNSYCLLQVKQNCPEEFENMHRAHPQVVFLLLLRCYLKNVDINSINLKNTVLNGNATLVIIQSAIAQNTTIISGIKELISGVSIDVRPRLI